ncbi:MAG: YhcH/YjgK/YiaL family protein [Methylococcales bacterium]|nr:YhcH/YjgK/YiaL family protein [Methylococcales bacterium]MBT7409401.1 YhcH/YjgK/YiaL family protein [Methylococcales bacterium]
MISDQIKNWSLYPLGNAWQQAFTFLQTLPVDAEEKKYAIQGDNIFAIVMSYETRKPENAVLEAHRKYLDIQLLLSGEEDIRCYPTPFLTVNKPYNSSKDVEFYDKNATETTVIKLKPGNFSALLPDDAHMPCLMSAGKVMTVKKVVVKVDVSLLNL